MKSIYIIYVTFTDRKANSMTKQELLSRVTGDVGKEQEYDKVISR